MEKQQNKLVLWISIMTLIIVITALPIFFTLLFSERTQCLKDPLIYGTKIIKDKTGESPYCNCVIGENTLRWNENGTIPEVKTRNRNIPEINFSLVVIKDD